MGRVVINGVEYIGNDISVLNNQIIINGKTVDENPPRVVEVKVEGNITNLHSHSQVTVTGNVGNIDAGNSVTVNGDVNGDVDAGNSVHCRNIHGNVDAGNSVYHS